KRTATDLRADLVECGRGSKSCFQNCDHFFDTFVSHTILPMTKQLFLRLRLKKECRREFERLALIPKRQRARNHRWLSQRMHHLQLLARERLGFTHSTGIVCLFQRTLHQGMKSLRMLCETSANKRN